MCEISEKWFREGEEQGRIEGARKTALECGFESAFVIRNGSFAKIPLKN